MVPTTGQVYEKRRCVNSFVEQQLSFLPSHNIKFSGLSRLADEKTRMVTIVLHAFLWKAFAVMEAVQVLGRRVVFIVKQRYGWFISSHESPLTQ